MAEPALLDQSYGHFGAPVYDRRSEKWIFVRENTKNQALRPLGPLWRAIKGTRHPEDEGTLREELEKDKRYDLALKQEIRRAIRIHPELAPAEDLLEPLLRSSEAVLAALPKYDPSVGDTLSYGVAIMSDGLDSYANIRLLAIPGGEGGEALRLVHSEAELYGWNKDNARLLVPVPTEEVGWWVGRGAPILQICASENIYQEDKGTLLAVRLSGTTIVLRPRYRASPVPPAGNIPGCTFPPSKVDANFLFEITSRDLQGQSHADVTFNPWKQHHLAIVDQSGNWTVFSIWDRKETHQPHQFEVLYRGTIEDVTDGEENSENPGFQDGWARILWVADRNTLLVCTRRKLHLFGLKDGVRLPLPALDAKKGWFLDARRCSGNASWLFVLTSSQIFWLEVFPEKDRAGQEAASDIGWIMLSVHHFRDPNDITLQLKIEEDAGEILAFLSSRNNPFVTCLRFKHGETHNLPTMTSEPTQLLLPVPKNGTGISISSFSIHRLEYDDEEDDMDPDLEELRPPIYLLQLLTNDLTLHHSLLCTEGSSHVMPHQKTKWRAENMISSSKDKFIVSNEFVQRWRSRRVTESTPALQKVNYVVLRKSKLDRAITGPTVQNEVVFEYIATKSPIENARIPRQNIVNIATELQNLVLRRDESLSEPARTLMEHAQCIPEVGELEDASEAIEDLLELSVPGPVPDEPELAVQRMSVPSWMYIMDRPLQELNFEGLYTHIIEHYLDPVAVEIAPRLRMAREKMARTVAAEVMLASSRIELVDQPEESQEIPEDSQYYQFSLPLHTRSTGKGKERLTGPLSIDVPFTSSQQSFSAPASTISRLSSFGSSTSPYVTGRTIIDQLQRVVQVNSSPLEWSSRPLKILAHWDAEGTDPSTYNYRETLHNLEHAEKEESMTDKQRVRARAKVERRLNRQRKEAEKVERMKAASSSQPVIRSSQARSVRPSPTLPSSPPPPIARERERAMVSSQIPRLVSSQVPDIESSQVFPGARNRNQGHGPKRKKRKMEGF